jgi:protein-export membrane protein SecD
MLYGLRLVIAVAAASLTAVAVLGIAAWALWTVIDRDAGGSWHIVLEIDRNGPRQPNLTSREAIDQSIPVLTKRLDELAVAYRKAVADGEDRIVIDVPGSAKSERLEKVAGIIGKAGKLEFRMVDTAVDPQDVQPDRVPPDDDLLYKTDSPPVPMLVEKRAVIRGADLADARASIDFRTGEPVVDFSFNSKGTRRFARATQENVGRPFAIVLDGEVLSAPVIREPILGGRGIISGNFTVESAANLAILLRAGALPANFTLVEIRRAEPASTQH